MSYDDEEVGIPVPRPKPHYHGDKTRVIFVASAIILIVAQSTGVELPLSTTSAVVWATVLVIAAGVTSPTQTGIHWFSALLSLAGTLLFGITAVSTYRAGVSLANPSFLYIEALALLSIVALYLNTRTIRGRIQHARD
ncbi:hypothetical protein EXS57_01515 [Candidatus Kaiserbacteria bacterium]|nr:hypothetical protein [Candidatus Kaiserbacteria bacterium]